MGSNPSQPHILAERKCKGVRNISEYFGLFLYIYNRTIGHVMSRYVFPWLVMSHVLSHVMSHVLSHVMSYVLSHVMSQEKSHSVSQSKSHIKSHSCKSHS